MGALAGGGASTFSAGHCRECAYGQPLEVDRSTPPSLPLRTLNHLVLSVSPLAESCLSDRDCGRKLSPRPTSPASPDHPPAQLAHEHIFCPASSLELIRAVQATQVPIELRMAVRWEVCATPGTAGQEAGSFLSGWAKQSSEAEARSPASPNERVTQAKVTPPWHRPLHLSRSVK